VRAETEENVLKRSKQKQIMAIFIAGVRSLLQLKKAPWLMAEALFAWTLETMGLFHSQARLKKKDSD
jgi:hypothetical protein